MIKISFLQLHLSIMIFTLQSFHVVACQAASHKQHAAFVLLPLVAMHLHMLLQHKSGKAFYLTSWNGVIGLASYLLMSSFCAFYQFINSALLEELVKGGQIFTYISPQG